MIDLPTTDEPVRLVQGDCRDVLPTLPSASFDAVVCDPPYPEIDREYGRWTEAEWRELMDAVVNESRRVLKPSGSAVFILQPNSERVGRMRTWLWRFMADWGERWGMVQDAWWWNIAAMPEAHAIQGRLMRPSLKACVWLGSPDCYRDQDAALWPEAAAIAGRRLTERFEGRREYTSGHGKRATIYDASAKRGGVTPFNVMPVGSDARWSGGTHGHPASTPIALLRWWINYICPPGGLVLDPFVGSGTVALTALAERRRCVGIERRPEYVEIARKRLAEPMGVGGLFPPTESFVVGAE